MSALAPNGLQELIRQQFPTWLSVPDGMDRLHGLSDDKAAALGRALEGEVHAEATFALRESRYADLYQFDFSLGNLFAAILASRTPFDSLIWPGASPLFSRNAAIEADETQALAENGYLESSCQLSPVQLASIRSELSTCDFISKGIFPRVLSGQAIYARIGNGSLGKAVRKNGDTFWLRDQNALCHRKPFQELAFDPYILATVARYLGCCPIHVQTNAWFSFPTFEDKWNVSANAQMFHQDKEFCKFIKVFIYLSDVGEDNGPHCYVEGSHVDEAHAMGVALSDRIQDDEILRYYPSQRIRKLTGPAGTIAFGDTSCVHRGMPVRQGHRVMLQLEYAASLYLSPVSPFSELPEEAKRALPYPGELIARLTANYADAARAEFSRMSAQVPSARPSALGKLVQLARRHLR